jgi:selenocysteine lyase/cysteine desulfurase
MPVDWSIVREQFPALKEWTYLNTATMGLIATRTRAAVDAHFARRDELANTDFASWWDDVDRLRATIARMIGCTAADIAFLPNASTALALARSAIEWRDGDEILTLRNEFPNQSYVAATLHGVRLVETPLDRFWECVSARTRMVAISAVNYQTGLRVRWEEMVSKLRERGIVFYVDGTQSFGALVTSLAGNAPDLFAVDCYKWACAPAGAAFAYVHPDLRKRCSPAVVGWRSDAGWRDMHNLRQSDPVFPDAAEKYEGGMLAFPSLYGLGASLEFMREAGPADMEERTLALAKACGGDGISPIVIRDVSGREPTALAEHLRRNRIVVSARGGKLRISPHFYNNEADVTRLLDAIG